MRKSENLWPVVKGTHLNVKHRKAVSNLCTNQTSDIKHVMKCNLARPGPFFDHFELQSCLLHTLLIYASRDACSEVRPFRTDCVEESTVVFLILHPKVLRDCRYHC